MSGSTLGVAVVVRKTECSSEHREVVHARELPDLLYISRDVLGAVVDLEAILSLRSSPTGDGIEEPVRVHHVLARDSQNVPLPRKDLLGRSDDLLLEPGSARSAGSPRSERHESEDSDLMSRMVSRARGRGRPMSQAAPRG